jgi:hypothetical protein
MLFWPRDADKSPETGSLAGHVGTQAAIFFLSGKTKFLKVYYFIRVYLYLGCAVRIYCCAIKTVRIEKKRNN